MRSSVQLEFGRNTWAGHTGTHLGMSVVFKAIKAKLHVDRRKEEQRLSPRIHLHWHIDMEGKTAKGDGRKAISEAERKLGEWGVLEAKWRHGFKKKEGRIVSDSKTSSKMIAESWPLGLASEILELQLIALTLAVSFDHFHALWCHITQRTSYAIKILTAFGSKFAL